jgi:hypothetical protein
MDDPVDTVKSALYDNWSLTGSLAKAKIQWITGQYVASARAYPCIEVSHRPAGFTLLPSGNECRHRVAVDVWVRCSALDNQSLVTAKANRWSILGEIRRIIEDKRFSLSGLCWIWPDSETPILDPDVQVLRTRVELIGFYVVE